jgi:hypothetical protein
MTQPVSSPFQFIPVDNPLIARADFIEWGDLRLDLPDEVWRLLGKE